MFNMMEMGNGAFICIDNRLIVHNSFKAAEIVDFVRELRGVDEQYDSVFEIASFVTFHGLEKSMVSLINQMPVGDKIELTETTIIKVAEHLCVGIMKEVEYCYNVVKETIPVKKACEEKICLTN